MKRVRKQAGKIAALLLCVQLFELIWPLHGYALTGGPSVPEVQQLTQSGEPQLVNLFTGDFTYNIPLLDVGGYPVSISYNSNSVNMEADATCVGLGWNLDIGAISRDVRGLPDDFNGEKVAKAMNIKPKVEIGVTTGFSTEFVGFDFAKFGHELSTTISRSNYDGWEIGMGMSQTQKFSADCGDASLSGSLDFGVSISNKGGAGFDASGSLSGKMKEGEHSAGVGAGLSLDVNSRHGVKSLSFNAGVNGGRRHRVEGMQYTVDRVRSGSQNVNFKFPVSFSSPSYSPAYDMPLRTIAGDFSFKLGGEVPLMHLSGSAKGTVSVQELVSNFDSVPAYGYIYSHNTSGGKELLDLNREKDGSFIAERPNLPVTAFTHDIYTVTGQGVGGCFRPFRSDVGMLHDPLKTQDNTAISSGGEVGLGQLVKVGVDIKLTLMKGQTKKWQEGNTFADPLGFKATGTGMYEPVYFKNMGEATAMANPAQFNSLGGYSPIRAVVGNNGTTTGALVYGNNNPLTAYNPANVLRTNREPRNTHFAYLNAGQAVSNALEKEIRSYKADIKPSDVDIVAARGVNKLSRTGGNHKGNHLSEITITRPDGMRYVYGIPAYSNFSTDVSFNVSNNGYAPDSKKMIQYVPGQDNTVRNNRGLDNFYEAETTPAHPYAWLLTGVVSDDYVDLTGNGPSTDDLGNYTRINYTRTHNNYVWRVPMEQNKAIYQEGTKSDPLDNKAHYSYGSKEIWDVHSVESRNYEAMFYYSQRTDGVAALGNNGGLNTAVRLNKLDSIVLYSKSELMQKGSKAIAIKKVFFEYTDTLCRGISNSAVADGGKLTLTKISFAYGESEKGRLSPYVFTYSNTNPNYNPKKIDKWGNYLNKSGDDDDASSYAKISKENADKYASAWLLTGIRTPEGSNMVIDYESDDYAYVQDKTAMELFAIKGLTAYDNRDAIPTEASLTTDNKIYEGGGDISVNRSFNCVKFQLKKPTADPAELEAYIKGINELFFSAQINLAADIYPDAFEKVDGFVPVNLNAYNAEYGFCTGGGGGPYTHAWIRLPLVVNGDGNAPDPNGVHPFAKAAWQKIRKSMPELIYNDRTPMNPEEDFMAFAKAAVGTLGAIAEFFFDPNTFLRIKGHAKEIDISKSKIRLNTPHLTKCGGGARVKSITVKDNWDTMTGMPNTGAEYGTEYIYKTTTLINGRETEISSGVATYEPATNADENPFALPTRYSIEKPLSIDVSLYQVGPAGEIFFAGAGIGYSKVKVRNKQYANVTQNATGFTTHEFYTAYDFPAITTQTDMQVNPKEVPFPPFYFEKQATVSQGFCIELNDMHGKQKAVKVYQQTDSLNPISGQQFFYKTYRHNQLLNSAQVADAATGNITTENFGLDYEVYADARESVEETYGPGVEINTDAFMASFIPVSIPGIYPQMNYAMKRYRALTFTKVLHRSGILDRTEMFNNGTNVSISTTVYDKQTGQPVVTEARNEFGQKQYGLNIPAYWVNGNQGMDAAYKNQGTVFTLRLPNYENLTNLLSPGDELALYDYRPDVNIWGMPGLTTDAPPAKAWVLEVTPGSLALIDEQGVAINNSGTYNVRIMRSGKRNKLNELAGNLQSLTNPVTDNRLAIPATGVINAHGNTYGNVWQTYSAFTATQPQYRCACRPFADKLGKSYKSVAEAFVRKLFTTGDYNETGVNLSSSDYTEFSSFLAANLSRGERRLNALRHATEMQWEVVNSDSTVCTLTLSMADGTTTFPDSILSLTLNYAINDAADNTGCDNSNTLTGTITYRGGFNNSLTNMLPSTATAQVRLTSGCLPFMQCEPQYTGEGAISCSPTGSGKVNPFVCGILGNWRSKADYAYRSDRTTGNNATGGTYSGSFNSFFSSTFPLSYNSSIANWQTASTATIYDPFGKNIETKSTTGIYTSEVYGYGFSAPVLTASNARYFTAAFDGFEDYQYKNTADNPWNDCRLEPHFKFDTALAKISRENSHTGHSSLLVTTNAALTRNYYPYSETETVPVTGGTFMANRNHLVQTYTPAPGKYVLSAWIYKGSLPAGSSGGGGSSGSSGTAGNLLQNIGSLLNNPQLIPGGLTGTLGGITGLTASGDIKIKCTTNTGSETVLATATAEGKSIDGWRQINATFDIPANVRSISIELTPGTRAWYDDIRVQPFNSIMKTYVYDANTLRIMATLDENNYASMYEYDSEGNLARTKRETEDNIITLQEIRTAKPKNR